MDNDIPYCYCFIRTDIPIEDQIVQTAHACLESGKMFQHPDNTHIVLLSLKSESKLIETAGFL